MVDRRENGTAAPFKVERDNYNKKPANRKPTSASCVIERFVTWTDTQPSVKRARPKQVVSLGAAEEKLQKETKNSAAFGLQAGENTLNLLCALRVAQVLSSGHFVSIAEPAARAAVLSDYVHFLTTPGSHSDTYAESFHRSFFSDWQELRPTSPIKVLDFAEKRCKEMINTSFPDSQLNAIGCLPMAIPFVLLSVTANEDKAVSAAVEFVKLTHPYPKLDTFVALYARALHATLNGACLKQQVEQALKSPALNAWDTCQHYIHKAERFPNSSEERLKVHQKAAEALGLACYTKGALSSLFYLAYVFHNDVKGGILVNTNCGGENCNRGAALGALLGARAGYAGEAIPQDWKDGLRRAKEEIHNILKNLP
ncbi:uncharacterized protein LOC118798284 isoform X2 [Colossoma macropomum]|uniref:uncharacterized protein LOC118798284 isoform X2 n=1 Tax=Colossoma macropomum TaxID=42526 RepID=UPI0018654C72|nr:uncharacterized protein LOC118798284 isoform X2 [Colossoma macropomum]